MDTSISFFKERTNENFIAEATGLLQFDKNADTYLRARRGREQGRAEGVRRG